MSATETLTPPRHAAPTERRTTGWRRAVRWFGALCLMLAAGFGGYVAWLLWGTGLETQRAQDRLRVAFEESLDDGGVPTPEVVLPGGAYAQIEIPAIGVNFIVVEGTDHESLRSGPGHYPRTADPWDAIGRVGIAGHRTTYLHPFLDLDRAEPGQEIVLRTDRGTFTYEIDRTFVIPSAGSGRVLSQTVAPSLVLTTCHPKYSSAERLIVVAERVGVQAA